MKLFHLTHLLLHVNSALDSSLAGGDEARVSVADVERPIEARDVIPWLRGRLAGNIDLSLYPAYMPEAMEEIHEALARLLATHGVGKELRRNWGVENSGLCLLVAWLTELIGKPAWEGIN
jgi:hypothetical protein